MKSKVIILSILFFVLSCKQNSKNKVIEIDKTKAQSSIVIALENVDSIDFEDQIPCKKSSCRDTFLKFMLFAIETGDTKSYDKAMFYLGYSGNSAYREAIHFSYVMANKYNYGFAHYEIYSLYMNIFIKYKIDYRKERICLYHLIKSYELGYTGSIPSLKIVFGDLTKIPKSEIYLYL